MRDYNSSVANETKENNTPTNSGFCYNKALDCSQSLREKLYQQWLKLPKPLVHKLCKSCA